jgi:hypothetical protein
MDKHLDAFVVMGGNFNTCVSEKDSLNRLKTKQESYLTDVIKSNNRACEKMDFYRSIEIEGGIHGKGNNDIQVWITFFVSGYLASKSTKVQLE